MLSVFLFLSISSREEPCPCFWCVCLFPAFLICLISLSVCLQTQRATMAKFREGKLNLLVATHVGAEGLNFGCCGLVMLLDPPSHVVDYLQCRWADAHML